MLKAHIMFRRSAFVPTTLRKISMPSCLEALVHACLVSYDILRVCIAAAHRSVGILGILELAVALNARGDDGGDLDGLVLLAVQRFPGFVVGADERDLLSGGRKEHRLRSIMDYSRSLGILESVCKVGC